MATRIYTHPTTVSGSKTVPSLGKLTDIFETERQAKYKEGMAPLQQILELFGPGYGKGMEKKAIADMMAGFVSSGLAPTTMPTAVSAGIKSQTEDIRRSRLADALSMISQYVQQSTPTPGLVGQTAQATNVAERQPGSLSPYMQNYGGFNAFPGGAPLGWIRKGL